jgi:HEAT repeat protein
MSLRALILMVAMAYGGVACAADRGIPLTVDQAIQSVLVSKDETDHPPNGLPFALQVYYRLIWLLCYTDYKYEEGHAAAWKASMLDEHRSMYARLCSAYFLLDKDEDARDFIMAQIASKNLRYRFNATKVVEIHVNRDSTKTWGVKLLIELLANGSIDDTEAHTAYTPEEDPYRIRNDFVESPIEDICWDMGFMKEKAAVPALISVLGRIPSMSAAAFALGEIGDEKAIPILMKRLQEGPTDEVIVALGKLKVKEAVPLLVSRLKDHPVEVIWALGEIGDKQAISPIEEYMKAARQKEFKSAAQRVLAQLNSPDPVKSLVDLFDAETDELELRSIVWAMAKYKDPRAVDKMENIARSSNSAFMRSVAICGLVKIGDQRSLLILVALLNHSFPKDLKAEYGFGTGRPPDFAKYFPETIAECLKQCTKQDFGQDQTKWEEWIKKNVKQEVPAGADSK